MAKKTITIPASTDTSPHVRTARWDGWLSALTGFGVTTQDKTQSTSFKSDVVSYDIAMDLWRGDDIAARIIETLPQEELRQGFELTIADDKDYKEELMSWSEELGLLDAMQEARCYERAYGGAAIMMGALDGSTDLTLPLNLARVRDIKWLTVLEPREMMPVAWYNDPDADGPNYGMPSVYQFQPIGRGVSAEGKTPPFKLLRIHESRLLLFPGIRVSRRRWVTGAMPGWGDSVLTRCIRVLRDFNVSWGSAGILVHDFAQAVFKIKGLAELIALDKDEIVKNRLRAVELSRSTARAVLIDAEEEFERKQTPVSGLPDLLDRFSTRLAAAADMPLTLLMGQSPAGLNATGESDIRFFYDRVKSSQRKRVLPPLRRFFTVAMASKRKLPKKWSLEFKPLWQPSEAEQATARFTQAQTDAIYEGMGAITAEEVAVSRFSGDDYSFHTSVDFDGRRKFERPVLPAPPKAPRTDGKGKKG